jgi:hypothetical protein
MTLQPDLNKTISDSEIEPQTVFPKTATFDETSVTEPSLGDLKKLQDPTKFGKARFSFKLYKR